MESVKEVGLATGNEVLIIFFRSVIFPCRKGGAYLFDGSIFLVKYVIKGLGWLSKILMTEKEVFPNQLLPWWECNGAIPVFNQSNIIAYHYCLVDHSGG